ncbi:MAG: SufS family cysteine desulfurase [Candidatus Binatia bacterium]
MSPATAGQKRQSGGGQALDAAALRADFPILEERVRDKPLVYLDNAATTQKPTAVIDALSHYYQHDNANVHRGVHTLSERATEAYEAARARVGSFVGAHDACEIVFVRGTTEAINLVANSYVGPRIGRGDEILITHLEHHSNIVPWRMLCDRSGATLKVVPINDDGELLLDEFERLIGPKTRLVGVNYVSNALGTVAPVAEIVEMAHAKGAPVLVDAAQAVSHLRLDVQQLDCDFLAFSGHKVYGPTGIGALYAKADLLEDMPPWQGGGEMILSVSFDRIDYNTVPHRFEAGTPNVAGAVGLAAALDYLDGLGLEAVAANEARLLEYARAGLETVRGLRIVGQARQKVGLHSFVFDDVHPHDVGTILDDEGIAIRTGHHCAQPLMERFGLVATARASFALYNTEEDVDRLVAGLAEVRELFG